MSTPLRAITYKGNTLLRTPECREALDRLKVVLTSAPVLARPDEESPFALDGDAAQTTIGADLSQRQQGAEKVVTYASRKL